MLKSFQDYCWMYYGPNKLCGQFFDHKLTRPELNAACKIISLTANYEGDSIDREKVRELLFFVRDTKTLTRRAILG